jgi:hypothetical protein
LLVLLAASLACNFPGFGPPPARGTATLTTSTFVPIGGENGTPGRPPTQSQAPLIDITLRPSETVTATPAETETPTPTPETPTAQTPLTITNVLLVGVERDPSRPNGAIAKIQIEFTGGQGPFKFFDENIEQEHNPVDALTACGATLVHTVRVDSADGQTDSQAYYFSPVNCPP